MRKFPFPRIHGPDYDLCIRSMLSSHSNNSLTLFTDLHPEVLFLLKNPLAKVATTTAPPTKAAASPDNLPRCERVLIL